MVSIVSPHAMDDTMVSRGLLKRDANVPQWSE
jgi:hypothetical protein